MLSPHRGELFPLTSNDQSPTSDPVPSTEPAEIEPATDEQIVSEASAPKEIAALPNDEPVASETSTSASEAESSLGDTAGTGTIIALGCITGTVFLIVLGLIYLLVTQVFG